MTNNDTDTLLSAEMRERVEQIAATRPNIDGQRAAALLAVDAGQRYAEAAAANGLTEGQVGYIVRKFREQGLDAFPPAGEAAEPQPVAADDEAAQLRALNDELNARVAELQQMVDEQRGGDAARSPLRLLTMIRDNLQKLTPEMQLDVLRNFQGMSAEDLLDLDTWKGMAYMMAYSARFQAGQVRDKVSGVINQVVPEPIQPGRLWQLGKSGLDRVTPEFAKQILGTFQGATREDLMDPDTWKGVWTMINYSLQFQAEQLKQRLSHSNDTQSD
ncbi:helix-turn-helix domain-containing protein [Promineifilum sp.]|uniref:helix-turn-helix domain-containing protein n=1 Tax=Promineifilum sp. TaxID=2664178 RepID=UPI0035B38684